MLRVRVHACVIMSVTGGRHFVGIKNDTEISLVVCACA
jgi:hypothetical protein